MDAPANAPAEVAAHASSLRRNNALGTRLRKRREFDDVFRRGRRYRGRLVHVVIRLRAEDAPLRHAVIVSKRVHKRAVQRNRVKRRLREAWRLRPLELSRPADVVILAQPGSHDAGYHAFAAELWQVLEDAGLRDG